MKNMQEVEQWNIDLFISLIPGALNEVSRVSLVSRNKGDTRYLNFSDNFNFSVWQFFANFIDHPRVQRNILRTYIYFT